MVTTMSALPISQGSCWTRCGFTAIADPVCRNTTGGCGGALLPGVMMDGEPVAGDALGTGSGLIPGAMDGEPAHGDGGARAALDPDAGLDALLLKGDRCSDSLCYARVWFLCSADGLELDGAVASVGPEEALQSGQLYFVLPAVMRRRSCRRRRL
jgi:hypothetical protein